MPPCPRKEIFDPDEVGVYHCFSRCVRRAFLCGRDSLTGQSFDHPRDWLEQDTARLASIFAIDVLDICVMDNHPHHVLRNRPDIADTWSDAEDSVAGHFWAERFKSTRLLDEAAVLVGSIYVDLNMIRAGQAATPEDSRYTWTGRQIRGGASCIPDHLSPILERLGIVADQ